jgi:hypothetical protein
MCEYFELLDFGLPERIVRCLRWSSICGFRRIYGWNAYANEKMSGMATGSCQVEIWMSNFKPSWIGRRRMMMAI